MMRRWQPPWEIPRAGERSWERPFLVAVAAGSSVIAACELAPIARARVYAFAASPDGAVFADLWHQASEHAKRRHRKAS